ncbi:MAG TPA: hypothetical protein VF145_07705 [Chitinophagaceae bacterium]
MNYLILTYACYLVITICITIWVATTLFRNGKVFLLEIFHGNKELAESVNNLLLVGFYLVNLGYAIYTLQIGYDVTTLTEALESLSLKTGWIILVLGGMHFLNLFVFFKLRHRAQTEKRLARFQPPLS